MCVCVSKPKTQGGDEEGVRQRDIMQRAVECR